MNERSIACVQVADTDAELGVERPEKYSAGAQLTLGQFWKGADALPAERAHAFTAKVERENRAAIEQRGEQA